MFSIWEAIRFGWKTTKENFFFLVGIFFFAILITILPAFLIALLQDQFPLLTFLLSLGNWILQTVIQLGMVLIPLRFVKGEEAKFLDLFSGFPFFLYYVIASIFYVLILIGGLILLVIPAIIWALQFQFFVYFIVDKDLGPIQALKKSSQITKGSKWKLFCLALVIFLINLVGVLCLIVGLLVTIPISMTAMAFVYRKLLVQETKT